MLKASARCLCAGLLWAAAVFVVDGLIEIVEEQKCHDSEFRLTCRDLDSHIAVLEAWYTSMEDLYRDNTTHEDMTLKTENDPELDRVYVYSSPKHNGVYEASTHSVENFENISVNSLLNETLLNFTLGSNETLGEVEFLNVSEGCSGVTFSSSFASWKDREKGRRVVARKESVNVRAPLSYRCMGVNHCNFLLSEDYPPSVSWVPGIVYIKYACFDDTTSVHYCNREISVAAWGAESEGYIRSPGYPHFYVGDECRWRIRSHPEQKIRVTFLDVSLRSIGPFESSCADQVTVQDSNGDQLLSTCDQVPLPLRLTSTTEVVDVAVQARSKGAYPKRGVLLHYKSVGCVTLTAPSNGYLVYRNDDVAHYMCNVNHVFIDTRQRTRLIWCFDDNRWNDTVPFCIDEASIVFGNESTDGDRKMAHDQPNMIVDIVIPSILIAALFMGNAFIVLVIYKYRKRKGDDVDEEFNTIPLSANGNVHNAGNAV